MSSKLCKGGPQRDRWAISLCFSSALLMSLEALRPNACAWMGFTADQSFRLSAAIATLSLFLGSYILARLISGDSAKK